MRTWRLPADVDTDQLAPGATMKHGLDVTARHCLERVRPDFAAGVRRGDVIVAGPRFGIGSSREQAASVLVHLGVAAVIAPSYAGLYFRNAGNVGLLLLTCAHAEAIRQFLAQGLHLTARRTGVLIFASVAEHHAEIVADTGINEKVDQAAWQDAVDAMIAAIKDGRPADGFVAAVERCGALLARHFPPGAINRDELPNKLVVM